MTETTTKHKFPYEWRLADGYPAKGIKKHGCKVFGTFICGGGSSMGYKLAGYEHLGGVELDPKIAAIYKENHHPKYLYNEDIRDFNKRTDLPDELYNLDILDGSPPCTTFSMVGQREKTWGKKKKFAEGQKLQRLDDLVFVYADTILKLRPKVCILENVAGLARGNAKAYLKTVANQLSKDYRVQVFLLNGNTMGEPQLRQRCFIIGLRRDFDLPPLRMDVNEEPILFGEIRERNVDNKYYLRPTSEVAKLFPLRKPTDRTICDIQKREQGRYSNFTQRLIHDENVCGTLITTEGQYPFAETRPRDFTETEILKVSTFPMDYKFSKRSQLVFLTGMSVAPLMMAHVSDAIYNQWLSKINK